jgi:hypothetical protein
MEEDDTVVLTPKERDEVLENLPSDDDEEGNDEDDR